MNGKFDQKCQFCTFPVLTQGNATFGHFWAARRFWGLRGFWEAGFGGPDSGGRRAPEGQIWPPGVRNPVAGGLRGRILGPEVQNLEVPEVLEGPGGWNLASGGSGGAGFGSGGPKSGGQTSGQGGWDTGHWPVATRIFTPEVWIWVWNHDFWPWRPYSLYTMILDSVIIEFKYMYLISMIHIISIICQYVSDITIIALLPIPLMIYMLILYYKL